MIVYNGSMGVMIFFSLIVNPFVLPITLLTPVKVALKMPKQ